MAWKMKRRAGSHTAGVFEDPDCPRGLLAAICRPNDRADAAVPFGLIDFSSLKGCLDRLQEALSLHR
jgi:hypothetical protein